MRPRRACLGELVQIDGSPYDWFEGRAPACSLLVFIDDASGRLLELYFTPQESFFSYCAAVQRYLTAPRQAARLLQRQTQHLPRQCEKRRFGHGFDPVWPRDARVGHPNHLRQYPPGQGPR